MSTPDRAEVNRTIAALEMGWYEAWCVRRFYGVDGWTRFRAFMGKERLFIGPVGINGWYPFKVLAVAAFFLLAAWWRAGW